MQGTTSKSPPIEDTWDSKEVGPESRVQFVGVFLVVVFSGEFRGCQLWDPFCASTRETNRTPCSLRWPDSMFPHTMGMTLPGVGCLYPQGEIGLVSEGTLPFRGLARALPFLRLCLAHGEASFCSQTPPSVKLDRFHGKEKPCHLQMTRFLVRCLRVYAENLASCAKYLRFFWVPVDIVPEKRPRKARRVSGGSLEGLRIGAMPPPWSLESSGVYGSSQREPEGFDPFDALQPLLKQSAWSLCGFRSQRMDRTELDRKAAFLLLRLKLDGFRRGSLVSQGLASFGISPPKERSGDSEFISLS